MEENAEGQPALKGNDPSVAGREADQRLFDQALTSIAQDDAIANSGHKLYRRVNNCARDYMEAKQIVERKDHEIAAISTKIESMQAIMDQASKHLHKAQAIAADAIDSSVSEQFRLREQDNLIDILLDMTTAISKGNCHSWPRDKVNKCLEVCSPPCPSSQATQCQAHRPPSPEPRARYQTHPSRPPLISRSHE